MKANHSLSLMFYGFLATAIACGTYIGNPEEGDSTQTETEGVGDPEDGDTPGTQDPVLDPDSELPDEPIVNDPSGAADSLFTLALTDAPIDDLQSFFITISEVIIRQESGGLVNIPISYSQEIDLLNYQGSQSIVFAASNDIPLGNYSEIRVTLDPNNPPRAIDKAGGNIEVNAPSAETSGIKIASNFTVDASGIGITLDFDLRKSLKVTGPRLKLSPKIRAAKNKEAFGVAGLIQLANVVCIYEEGTVADTTDECDNALSAALVGESRFKIGFVPNGRYYLRFFQDDSSIDSEIFTVDGKNVRVDEPSR
ncbi:DUF4382 domain-containing protein [Pseudobacteriovorax antillogorgiicola]|uniref:DUF4382 domain-containing protein n=1 Tax=Pseudobacteriovorax antillogorgiicola TaxID=1513793 RepID=A0A1Y6BSJ4_9BACT|nr:DUF4382 domain-containing protein [Pseudobacteriovorax antillogorgiicola]TCS53060.1 uncharacterized protein DUF4382 [Pseudobacteriovorax antillogorgiicola]SMF26333.1 protein of unknown function [Pseudobacteriovorax antillogorgiicola]